MPESHAGNDNFRLAMRLLRFASAGDRAEYTKFETTGIQAATQYLPKARGW